MFLAVLRDRNFNTAFRLIGLECYGILRIFQQIGVTSRHLHSDSRIRILCRFTLCGNSQNTVFCRKRVCRESDNGMFYRFVIFDNETYRCISFNYRRVGVLCRKQEVEYFLTLTLIIL